MSDKSQRPALRLSSTTQTLEGVLDAAGTDVIFTVCYYDTSGDSNQPDRGTGVSVASTGATDVTLLAAPAQNVTHNVDMIIVYNGNAATRVATVQIDVSGTNRILFKQSLLTTETFMWTPDSVQIV